MLIKVVTCDDNDSIYLEFTLPGEVPGTLQTSGFSNSKDISEILIDFFEWGVIAAISCLSKSVGHLQKTFRICNADPLFREKTACVLLITAKHYVAVSRYTILSFVKLTDLLKG